jgi:hypothetical protein
VAVFSILKVTWLLMFWAFATELQKRRNRISNFFSDIGVDLFLQLHYPVLLLAKGSFVAE